MRPNRVISCILQVYLLSLLVTEDGNEMIVMLERFQGEPLLSEKPLKASPLVSDLEQVAWCIRLLDTRPQLAPRLLLAVFLAYPVAQP